MMLEEARLMAIDAEPESRAHLRRELATVGLFLAGEAGFGSEALSLARDLAPDVILLSVEEPLARSFHLLEALCLSAPQALIVAISSSRDAEHLRRAMLCGARAYLYRPVTGAELRLTIRDVLGFEARRRHSLAGGWEDVVSMGTIISVFGAKGGIGKTTVATSVALALASAGGGPGRVVLVDMDIFFGDVAVMLNLTPKATVADLATHIDSVGRENLKEMATPHPSGLSVFSAPLHPQFERNLSGQEVAATLRLLAQTFDYVIVDNPGAYTEAVAAAVDASTMVLLLTSLDIASIKDTFVFLQMLEARQWSRDRIKLVVNHVNQSSGIGAAEVERELGHRIFWRIPYDPILASSTQMGRPLLEERPHAAISRNLTGLSYAVAGLKKPQVSRWRRLFGGG